MKVTWNSLDCRIFISFLRFVFWLSFRLRLFKLMFSLLAAVLCSDLVTTTYANQFYFAGSLLSRIIVKYVVYCATNIDILLKANWKELVATPAVFLICGGNLFTVWKCRRRIRAFFQFFPDEMLQDFQNGQHKPDPVMHFVGFVTITVKFSGGRPVLLDEINATPDFISIFRFPILFLGWGLVCFFLGWEKWPQKDSDDFVTYGRRVLDLKLCQNQD